MHSLKMSMMTCLSPAQVTVRGSVEDLCPAVSFMHSRNACEYAMHGHDGDFQCCPHGVTRPQGPPDECCVDDLQKTPYRCVWKDVEWRGCAVIQCGAGEGCT
jgi:hypothetical protein